MLRKFVFVFGVTIATGLSGATAQVPPREVRNAQGEVIEVLGPQGRPRDVAAGPSLLAAPVVGASVGTVTAPGTSSGHECQVTRDDPHRLVRESLVGGRVLDACGRFPDGQAPVPPASATALTIDRMTTRLLYGHYEEQLGTLALVGMADIYDLSDGSHWSSGAGSAYLHPVPIRGVQVSGSSIKYLLSTPDNAPIYQQTDYDFGDHSAQGELGAAGALVLEAQAGSNTATLRGNAVILSNDVTWYGEPRFNFYSALVGSIVPFEIVLTLADSTWTPDTFKQNFSYTSAGWVDFAHPISTPRAVELSILGSSRIPDEASTRFVARVRYESDVTRDVSVRADWSVEPAGVVSVAAGVVTVGTLNTSDQLVTLRADYTEGVDHLATQKTVRILHGLSAETPGTWPMYQADARHTGSLPVRLDPMLFNLRWQRHFESGDPLNPVTAGDGKVFVSQRTYFAQETKLVALRAQDGEPLWSKSYGPIFCANPPSYAYGNVYVQTGNHETDTWLRAYDGETGDEVFKAPHSAQWERYFAPTIHDFKVYVNGGRFGGMYAFDALSGERRWFAALPQVDQWTPAVAGEHAYAYLGDNTPGGLYVQDRLSGTSALYVADPNFGSNGWMTSPAPVVGSHEDVIATNNARLVSFDTTLGTIRKESLRAFTGQPSVARDQIYAVDDGKLVVVDELSHAESWSWQAPGETVTAPMIVTDTHVLVSTNTNVHAIDLITRQSVWSYPVSGQLAYADNTLYVASDNGTLTAFSAPPGDVIFQGGFQ